MDETKVEAPVIEHGFMQEVKPEEEKKVEPVDFFARIVRPHNKKSREVTQEDVPRLIKEANVLYNICFTRCGIYNGAHAVHHSQIDDTDPLNFFVTAAKEIIINPVMTRHTNALVDSKEGCVTFWDTPEKVVGRYHKSEFDFITLTSEEKLSEKFHISLVGKDSKIFQHETDHANGILIY